MGEEIISDLGTQRESLERTRARLEDADLELGRSRRILKKLNRGIFSNKIILVTVIILEVAILAGLCVWKFVVK